MAQKPDVKFNKLYQKLYNPELWLVAYERIAPKPGNMTAGVDGSTVDGMGMKLIEGMIASLRMSRYKPQPVRRVYIKKANGKMRPLGIPSFADKLLQSVVKLLLEAIYEPTFSDDSHGFRPQRSCHTALQQVKKMNGVRWWVEGDIVSFFDNVCHDTLIRILSQRISDQRFLHLIRQFLRAGYIETWQYHKTYSGTPQGSNLSPLLSNIYLDQLDREMVQEIETFNRGKKRKGSRAYWRICDQRKRAKQKAQETGDWTHYQELTQQMLSTPASDPLDPAYRRMYYCRYADDFLIGIVGSKSDAIAQKEWLAQFLSNALQLELSAEKTLITHAEKRVRFLGYDIQRGDGKRLRKVQRKTGTGVQRTCTYKLRLFIPQEKVEKFAKAYGLRQEWQGRSRNKLIRLSELEILMSFNAEIRGFLGYYRLADNLSSLASSLLWLTTTSFLKTLAAKRQSSVSQEAKRLKRGPNRYAVSHIKEDGSRKMYFLVTALKDMGGSTSSDTVDIKPNPSWLHHGHTELGQRLRANRCEWCGTRKGQMEVHHVRKLKHLKGKQEWERQMIRRKRKTMVLCIQCHRELHSGQLTVATRFRENRRAGCWETGTSGSEGRAVKPDTVMC
jgi:group II intron reverse transcriptase/maturase